MSQFDEYIHNLKTSLIIASKPLDYDCIASGLILKKYLEAQGIKVRIVHPEHITQADKHSFSPLPYFSEIEEQDTRELLKQKSFDLLVMVDGGNLSQFYDASSDPNKVPDLKIYDKRIQIDHHLTNEQLGTLNIYKTEVSSTTELILSEIIPTEFIDQDIATLGYAGIVGDTGNFRWNFYPSTMSQVATLLSKGANKDLILNKLFFSRSKLSLEMLTLAIQNIVFDDTLGSVFLYLPFKFIKENSIDENKLSILTDEFTSGIAIVIEGYHRGFVIHEKALGVIKISARGSSFGNKINLPNVLAELGGRSGGHFNACGATIEGNFEEVKNKLLKTLQKYLRT